MANASEWATTLTNAGYKFATGVPCSSLSALQDCLSFDKNIDFIATTNEGQAVASAAGACMGGRKSVVLMQNSGLGNAVNPLSSLVEVFSIPLLLIVSWRGKPGEVDEPQHVLMGGITHHLLSCLGIDATTLSGDDDEGQLRTVLEKIERTGRTCAIVVPDKSFENFNQTAVAPPTHPRGCLQDHCNGGQLLSRAEVLRHLVRMSGPNTIRIATTGKTGRELFAIQDSPQNLYVVGSMGLASSLGLGLARSVAQQVLVIDGDGAALMHLGAIPTIAAYSPTNMCHVILDNGRYDSTGGQISIASSCPFAEIAAACGYPHAYAVDDLDGLDSAYTSNEYGPVAIHMKIRPGSISPLPRPELSPDRVLARLRSHFGLRLSA